MSKIGKKREREEGTKIANLTRKGKDNKDGRGDSWKEGRGNEVAGGLPKG